jgi:TonB family protein
MKSNARLKNLLIGCMSFLIVAQILAQEPYNEVAGFARKKRTIFNKTLEKATMPPPDTPTYTSSTEDAGVYQLAHFPNWQQYAASHFVYPDLAREYAVEGVVQVAADISPLGEVVSVKVLKGLGYGCDEAIVKTLTAMPRWQPCLKRGKPQAQTVYLTMRFSLM